MYSPKINERQVKMLYHLGRETGKAMTALVREALHYYFTKNYADREYVKEYLGGEDSDKGGPLGEDGSDKS